MDWKEKGTETIFVGIIAFLGSLFVKKFKPSFKTAKRMYGLVSEVDVIKYELELLKSLQDAKFHLSSDCIFQCDKYGKCVRVNQSICDLFGADEDEMLGYGWADFIAEDERGEAEKYWKERVLTNTIIKSEYPIINRKTNTKVECSYIAYVKRDKGQIISIFGIVNKKQ